MGEGAVVGALRMGYFCLQVKDHPVIQTLLQLRNAAGAPLARTHAHTQLRARTRRPQTAPARHATCPETRREIWMPTLNVWYAQYSQYPTVPEGAETTPKQHRQAISSLRFCAGTTLEKLRPVDSKLKYQVSPSRASHVRLLECAKGLADRTMHACGLGL